VPFLAALCALGATLALSRAFTAREQAQLQLRTEAEAKHVASQLRASLLTSLDELPRMGEWWLSQGRPVASEDWKTDAQLFLRADLGLREVVWLNPQGKPLWCVKPGGKPDFHCASIDPSMADLAKHPEAVRSMVLSDVAVRQGVPRFYACTPIRRKAVIGFVVAAFDAPTLLQALLKEQMPGGYELRIAANGTTVTALPYSGAPLWDQGMRASTVRIANRWWSVELIPAVSDIQRLQRIIWSFGVIVSVLIYACAALALIYKRNESALRFEVEERRCAEKQIANLNRDLQNRVEDFRTLLNVLPVGIAVSNDPECRDIWVNPRLASMLGTSAGQNVSLSNPEPGRQPYKLVRDGAEVPAAEWPMQLAARSGKSVLDMELDVVRSDGSVLNTLSYAVPVFDGERNVRRVINAYVDVTERKRSERHRLELEDRLNRAEKYRSLAGMAAGVAHDFNNLLTTIIGYSDLARRDIGSGPAADSIRQVLGAAEQAAQLVDQLLAYTGQAWFELKPLDLSAEVRGMSAQIGAMVPPQIELELDLAPVLPTIQASSRQVRQVVSNLMANAVEAIGKGRGAVQVRTGWCTLGAEDLARDYPDQKLRPGAYVKLEVSDTGGGVSSEVAARVFDPFFTTKFLGRGLGLSAVHGIMLAHWGGVRLDSAGKRGTRVQAIFPVATAKGIRDRVA
jgi:signal transduction histidine kinase